jgi:hypothetical protein
MKKEFDFGNKEFRETIKAYVLKMLGAPILKIELDDGQLDLCVDRTCGFMAQSKNVSQWEENLKVLMAQDGALAHAKLMLGRVRAKFGFTGTKGVKTKPNQLGTNSIFPLDGESLLNEGERQYENWKSKVFD